MALYTTLCVSGYRNKLPVGRIYLIYDPSRNAFLLRGNTCHKCDNSFQILENITLCDIVEFDIEPQSLVESLSVESFPDDSSLIESLPVESLPVESLPVEPLLDESSQVESLPIESLSVEPLPVEPLPDESLPVESLPVESLPVESLPVESLPVESLPVESLPVESSPEKRVIEHGAFSYLCKKEESLFKFVNYLLNPYNSLYEYKIYQFENTNTDRNRITYEELRELTKTDEYLVYQFNPMYNKEITNRFARNNTLFSSYINVLKTM